MPEPRERRRAKLHLSPDLLQQLFEIPDDLTIVAAEGNNDPLGLALYVEGASLPVVPPDSSAPWARVEYEVISFASEPTDPTPSELQAVAGKAYRRVVVRWPEPEPNL